MVFFVHSMHFLGVYGIIKNLEIFSVRSHVKKLITRDNIFSGVSLFYAKKMKIVFGYIAAGLFELFNYENSTM